MKVTVVAGVVSGATALLAGAAWPAVSLLLGALLIVALVYVWTVASDARAHRLVDILIAIRPGRATARRSGRRTEKRQSQRG